MTKKTRVPSAPARSPAGNRARVLVGALVALSSAIVALFVLWYCARPLGASDVFWQVRTGEIAIDTHVVPSVDSFSYTIPGIAWNNHEWLFEIGAALLYRAAGWGAFRALVLLLFGGTVVAVGWQAAKQAGAAAGLLVSVLMLSFAAYKALPVPQLVSMALFLVAWQACRGRSLVTAPGPPTLLALGLLVWGNLTAEVLTFLPFVVVDRICLRRVRGASPAPMQRLALGAFGLALVAPLLNPPWASTLDYALSGSAVNRLVNSEFTRLWEPAGAIDQTAKNIAIGLIVLYLPWAVWRLVRAEDRWDALRRYAPSLLAIAAGTALERNLWMLVLPAIDLVSAIMAWATAAGRQAAASVAMVVLGSTLFAIWVPRGWTPAGALRDLSSNGYWAEDVGRALPLDCMSSVVKAPAGTRLYTLRAWAGYVIWRAHDVKVFIDGRNLEYPIDLFRAGEEVWEGGSQAQSVLDATQTQMVLAYPGWSSRPGVRAGGWTETRRGQRCAVFERAPR